MKIKLCPIWFWILFYFTGCTISVDEDHFTGFWEGPHPENKSRKFYIQLKVQEDTFAANGFWTHNHFFDSEFKVDSLQIKADCIRFYIPQWGCYYTGKLSDKHLIEGGFNCIDEPFDTVFLTKNNDISQYLTESKPGCLNPGYRYRYNVPLPLNDNILTAHFESSNDSLFLHSLVTEIIKNKYGRINSFLLVKNGRLVCEEYFYGYSVNDLHQIESSTKSITSLLVGIAEDKGWITDINERLCKIFPSFSHLKTGDYKNITIANLLSMTSGFSPDYLPHQKDDRIKHALNRNLVHGPGEKFIYDGGNTEILGAIMKIKTNRYADEFAEKYLFKPLKIENYDWSTFKQNGFPCMGGSLEMRPRDMAKIGILVLNRGTYNNKRIVPELWIDESCSAKIKTHIEGDDYGYHWWRIILDSKHSQYEAIWANGLGSQFIYVIPDLDVVIVTTGHNYENDSWAITAGISKHLYLLDY